MKQAILVRVLVGALLVAGAPAFAQSTSAVERLAERLLGYWGDPAVSRAEMFPEGLPPGIPFELPLPEGTDLVGSVAHYERGDLTTVQVVVDAVQAPDVALDEVLAGFDARGWVAAAMPPSVGFLPVQSSASGQACDPETGIFAFVHATSRAAQATDLRIDVNLAAVMYNPPCNAASLTPQPYADQAPLPALQAPVGGELLPHGTIHMPDQASSSALLVLDASTADVAAHYAGRLASAGWGLQSTRAGPDHVVATWSYADPHGSAWQGALTVVRMEGESPRFALSFFVTHSNGGG